MYSVAELALEVQYGEVPVPLNGTLFGEEAALLGMETAPLLAAAEVGEKVTPNVHVPVGATVAPLQRLLVSANSPLLPNVPRIKFPLPMFVSVNVFVALVVPTAWFPKFPLLGLMLTAGAVPVPLRATLFGDEGALLGIETVPVLAPVEVGEKVTPKVHVAAGASVALLH